VLGGGRILEEKIESWLREELNLLEELRRVLRYHKAKVRRLIGTRISR